MKTIYCIAFRQGRELLLDWYERPASREADKGSTGAATEVYFDFEVPDSMTEHSITAAADDMAWFKLTFPHKEVITSTGCEI